MIEVSKSAGNLELSLGLPGLLRSLCFGGLVGLLVTYLVCLNYPQLIIGGISINYFLVFGAALGSSLHRLIDGILVKNLLYPIRKRISYYAKVAELEIQKKKGLMEAESHAAIKKALDEEYFLSSSRRSQKLLINKV